MSFRGNAVVKFNLWFTDAEWVPSCELCYSNNYNWWYLHKVIKRTIMLSPVRCCQIFAVTLNIRISSMKYVQAARLALTGCLKI